MSKNNYRPPLWDIEDDFNKSLVAAYGPAASSIRTTRPELTLESVLDFGMHKGKCIEDLIEDAPDYLRWMAENEIREFDKELLDVLAMEGII